MDGLVGIWDKELICENTQEDEAYHFHLCPFRSKLDTCSIWASPCQAGSSTYENSKDILVHSELLGAEVFLSFFCSLRECQRWYQR